MMKRLLVFVLFWGCANTMFAQNNASLEDTDDVTFTRVEVEAEFPGGLEAWKEYLMKNLKADVPSKKRAPDGTYTVIVRFIVWKDGRIEGITAETNHGYGMEKEVMRVIRKGPKWKPAMQNGNIVKAYRRQPITFVVSSE